MRESCWKRTAPAVLVFAAVLSAQQNPPLMVTPQNPAPAQPAPPAQAKPQPQTPAPTAPPPPAQAKPQPQTPAPTAPPPANQAAKPAAPAAGMPAQTPAAGTPAPTAPPPANQAAKPAAPAAGTPAQTPAAGTTPQSAPAAAAPQADYMLDNVSLVEFVDILARRLKLNILIDPKVNGKVTIHTYGEVKPTELMPLMETVLRVNGCAMVKVGDLYRIVPVALVPALPITPQVNAGKDLPDDERMLMNMVFLKYVTVADLYKLLQPFMGEGAQVAQYEAANLLIILDNSRNMKRTMDLVATFDSDAFATQRVRTFEVKNGRPSDLAKELEGVFKAFALSDKSASVRFLPVERINTILAVAPNPGIFAEVQKWLEKLDLPVKASVGGIQNYVYRLKYGRAETVAMAIMALYSGNPYAMMGLASMMSMSGGVGGAGGGFGSMMPGMAMLPGMMGGAMPYGGMGGYPGMYGGGYGGYGGYGGPPPPMASSTAALAAVNPGLGATPGIGGPDLTGQYLSPYGTTGTTARIPHVIPNPFDNTLLVQGTPQEWEQISKLLEQLDIPPRQVLIEAKIYQVDLSGALSGGVDAYLQHLNEGSAVPTAPAGASRTPLAANVAGIGSLTTGLLVDHSRALLALVTLQESKTKAKAISTPSIIATDSIPASINVGQDVPTLTSQAVAGGVQQGGNSLFSNTVGSRSTGVTLNITARVNSSGVVTLVISQNVSAPQPTTTSGIQSPTFANKSVSTQVTVQDGDTIAIAGIIEETDTSTSAGIPYLHRIPVLGAVFGAKSHNTTRTELIIFLTPRVIYDTNQIAEASEEIKSKLKRLQKLMKE